MIKKEKNKIKNTSQKNKYFDEWQFQNAYSVFKTDPYEARRRLSNYLEKYPLDNSALIYYANIFVQIGKFKEALEIINRCDKVIETCEVYKNHSEKYLVQKKDVYFIKIRTLMYLERYNEAYDLYLDSINLGIALDIEKVIFFCKNKLGLLGNDDREKLYYINRQTIEYCEEDFLYHAGKHCNDYFSNNNEDESEFAPDFPFEEIAKEIKEMIPNNKRFYPGFYDDAYIFKYDGCGACNKGVIDYLKVICFHDTNNIITMYPYLHGERLPQTDINYLKKGKESKVKRLSQIDKFNQRWKK